MDNTNISFLEFAWNSLTEQQQFRINVKYELKRELEANTGCKRDVYRLIAKKHSYTVKRIEDIANTKK